MNINLTKFDQLKADIQLYVAPIKDIVISSKESQDSAMSTAKELKVRLKKIEDLRKELKAPFKKAADEIDAYAKSIESLLAEPSANLNQKLLVWNRELERVRQLEVERIRKEELERQAAADKAAESVALVVQAEYERNEAQAISDVKAELKKVEDIRVKGVTLRWDFTIFDKSQIPTEYMVPNEVLIRKAITDSKGAVNIPGVEAFQKESLTIR